MTENDSADYSDSGSASSSESKPNWRRDLETRLKEAEARASEAESRISGYERRDTFRSAGLDPDDARVKYFVKGYDGELDPSAIRAEAEAAGFVSDNAPPVQQSDSIMPDVLKAEERIEKILGLRVNIANKKNNSGKISFEYKDLEQFELVSNLLMKR